ncbi:thioredoxin 1 [Desulfonatronum thiosulfatophilum]|uniref:Thioredoxin 1 n=1 Tax=Desulfonatronum thiosulfatophilum TaxID=617002 RepID=A0A1G6BYY9_9BACT|nr:thioredoxin family protein [Desulfonatronum thiosulfatophilum]SDB25845.1 thioredoxin 1 [Desulfonatronum thiosulfatophilum]
MTTYSKAGILVIIVALFASVALIQHYTITQSQYGPEVDPGPALPGVAAELPRLVNLKTQNCIHCKRMVPVLRELEEQYADAFSIYTFDVGVSPEIGRSFGTIRTVPTLVFMDQSGREVYRFEGYMSKSEVLERWRSLGLSV